MCLSVCVWSHVAHVVSVTDVLQGSEDAVRVVMLNNDYCISCFRCKVLYTISPLGHA